jgi:hypothetical protein
MPKRKIFLGAEEELQGNIVKWLAADKSILILNKTFMAKTSFVDQHPGEELIGYGDWVAIVQYEELSSDAQRVTGRPAG